MNISDKILISAAVVVWLSIYCLLVYMIMTGSLSFSLCD